MANECSRRKMNADDASLFHGAERNQEMCSAPCGGVAERGARAFSRAARSSSCEARSPYRLADTPGRKWRCSRAPHSVRESSWDKLRGRHDGRCESAAARAGTARRFRMQPAVTIAPRARWSQPARPDARREMPPERVPSPPWCFASSTPTLCSAATSPIAAGASTTPGISAFAQAAAIV